MSLAEVRVVIMIGGEMEKEDFLRGQISTDDYLICADRGADYAYKSGLKPKAIVGDFDSISDEAKDFYKKSGCLFLSYPPEKDRTDTEIAMDYALERGARELVITCALGGRVDHELGNIYLLEKLVKSGVKAKILSGRQIIEVIVESTELHIRAGKTVSLFALTDAVDGITTKGLKYPLINGRLSRGVSLGISNELVADRAHLDIKDGSLLVVQTRGEG